MDRSYALHKLVLFVILLAIFVPVTEAYRAAEIEANGDHYDVEDGCYSNLGGLGGNDQIDKIIIGANSRAIFWINENFGGTRSAVYGPGGTKYDSDGVFGTSPLEPLQKTSSLCAGNQDDHVLLCTYIVGTGRWVGGHCCGSGNYYRYSGNSLLCRSGTVDYACTPTRIGEIQSSFVCTAGGTWEIQPSTCTVGNLAGIAPTTGNRCCSIADGDDAKFDSTLQGLLCYTISPSSANQFGPSCGKVILSSSTANTSGIFLTGETNGCCGNDGIQNPTIKDTTIAPYQTYQASIASVSDGSNYFLKVLSTSTTSGSVFQNVSLIPGQNYTFTFMARADQPVDLNGNVYINPIGAGCPSASQVINFTHLVLSTQWRQYTTSGTWNAPAGCKAEVNLRSHPSAAVYYDDIYVLGPGLDVGSLSQNDDGQHICLYDNGWKWVDSKLAGNAYKINPVDSVYDSISNGYAWFSCDLNNIGASPPEFTQSIFQTLWDAQQGCSVYSAECQNIFELGGDSSSSPDSSGPLDLDEELPADLFLADVQLAETSIAPVPSTETSSGAAKIIVLPSQGNGNKNFRILIRGKEGLIPGNTILDNKIKVGDQPTNHSAIIVDGSGKFGLTEISLSQLDPGNHSINFTTEQGNNYFFINAFEVIESPIHDAPPVPNSKRFMCFNKAGFGEIQECTGYSYASALNANLEKARRVSETNAILENFGGTSQNNVRRILIQITNPADYTFSAGKFIVNEPFKITDWSSYDYLEFDVYSSISDVYVRFYNKIVSKSDLGSINVANDYYQQFRVLDYSIDGNELNAWHRIRISMSQINEVPDSIGFFIDGISAKNEIFDTYGSFSPFTFSGFQISMILGFDNVHLTRDSELNQKRFCSSWGEWIEDLDLDFLACENTVSTRWTVKDTLASDESDYGPCCGDDQGRAGRPNETFTGNVAGCWQGSFTANDEVARNSTLLFVNDTFLVCSNSPLTSVLEADSAAGNDFKNEPNVCTNKGSWYCSLDSSWKSALIYGAAKPINATKNESVTIDGNDLLKTSAPQACCPQSYCYNGTSCEASYENPKKLPIFRTVFGQAGYRCSDAGQWVNVTVKSDFNRNDTGYCNEETSCYAEGSCYKSGEWNVFNGADRMCNDGNWTTRSKYMSAALLDYVADANLAPNYNLFCDDLDVSLGEGLDDVDYPLVTDGVLGPNVNPYLGVGNNQIPDGRCTDKSGNSIRCVNSFCVLRFKPSNDNERVIVATSLNKRVDATYPFYQAFEFTDSDLETSAQLPNIGNLSVLTGEDPIKIFESSKSGILFYSPSKQVIFYSADKGITDFNPSFGGLVLQFIFNPIQSTFDAIRNLFAPNPEFNEVVNKTADFDRIYFAQKGSKEIVGIQETRFANVTGQLTTILAVSYKNFASDLSSAAEEANLNYNKTGTTQFIFGESSSRTAFNDIWPDLTAKIRIK